MSKKSKPHFKSFKIKGLDGNEFGLDFEDHDGEEKLLVWTLFPEDELISVLLSEQEARIMQTILNNKYGLGDVDG